jgi:hypothetical protein
VRFDVLTAGKMSVLVFWVVTPCGLVGRYLRRNILPPSSSLEMEDDVVLGFGTV